MYENLYNETIKELEDYNLTEFDVLWVGTNKEKMSWESFKKRSSIFWYDSGFGCWQVNLELIVVGKNWWLERHEYDGSERWIYKTMPQEPPILNKDLDIQCEYENCKNDINNIAISMKVK